MVYTLTLEQAQISIKIDKPFYFPGEIIKGVIYIKVKTKDIKAGLMYVKLCGLEKVNQVDQYNQFFSFKQFFYKKQKKITYFGRTMPITACKKYFEMEVPNLYPSFTINYFKKVQCRILYFLSVSIQADEEAPIYKPPKRHRVVVHILSRPQLSRIRQIELKGETKPSKKCCFETGITKIQISLDKSIYLFGENIQIALKVDNSQSNMAIAKIQFLISSQLIVLYKDQKRKLSNYFEISQSELDAKILPHSNKEIEYVLNLPQEKSNLPKSIFPQTIVKTKRIIYSCILTVNAIFEKSLFLNQQNLSVVVPLELYQTRKRETNNIVQSMDNISIFNSQSIFDTQQKINASQIKKIIYSDHNCQGYGEQDGYDGPVRLYNPVESFDQATFLGKKGALEKLLFKKQNEDQEGSDDEKLIEEIEGINLSSISLNQVQQQQPPTIFQQQQQQSTIFNTKKGTDFENLDHPEVEEGKLENGIQEQLQTIKEEQDSKGTQYNLNPLSSSGLRRNNSDNQQFQQGSHHNRVETFGAASQGSNINNETDELKPNQKIVSILKNPKTDSISIEQQLQQNQEQKESKQLKVQFNEATSADTVDGKNIDKQNVKIKNKNDEKEKQL